MFLFVLNALVQAVFGRFAVRPRVARARVVGSCPVRVPDFFPATRGAAFQTVFANLFGPSVDYSERETVGGAIVDWVHSAPAEPRRGVVVVFHGLGGSSASPGVRRVVREAARRGFAVAVFNRRGHAPGVPMEGEFPDHACDADTRAVVERVARRYSPVYAIGISAGANALVRYLGGESPSVAAAVSVCNPLDLKACYDRLKARPRIDAMLASWVMAVYARHRPRFGARSMRDFDESVTGRPLGEYYGEQGSGEALRVTRVPTLCMGAENDPIVDKCILDLHDEAARANPRVVSVRTGEGGHCGWVSRGGAWMEPLALDFLESCGETTGHGPPQPSS